MTEWQIISWIFLSIALASQEGPADYNGISMIADGINHAVPTQKELHFSISWLKNRGLVIQLDKKFSLSSNGKLYYNNVSRQESSIFQIWKNLENYFKSIDS